MGTGKERDAIGKMFIAVGVFSEELLAYKVSMVCAANWPKEPYNIGLSVWCHQSSELRILHIFSNLNISGTNADICKP